MTAPSFTQSQFDSLTSSQQNAILALARTSGAADPVTFDEELVDLFLGLFEKADAGCVLSPYFMDGRAPLHPSLRAKFYLIYQTASVLSSLAGSWEIVVQAERTMSPLWSFTRTAWPVAGFY
jgi:hypothetical protein